MQTLGDQYDVAAAFGGVHSKVNVSRLAGTLQTLQAFQAFAAALRFAGALPSYVAPDESLCPGDVFLLRLVLCGALGHPLGAQLHVFAIVPWIRFQPSVDQVPHAIDDLVQEIAVVGHHDKTARPGAEVFLQPLHGLQIQVVGGLVQQQQVGFLQEQAGQQGAGLLAVAERLHRPMKGLPRKAQPAQYPLDTHLVPVATSHLEGSEKLIVAGHCCLPA